MSDLTTIKRQLKIKTGVVKRLNKELVLYTKERDDQKLRVDKLKADGAEEWDIRSANKLLDEAEKMIPDAEGRLSASVSALREIVVEARKKGELSADQALVDAEESLGKSQT